MTGENDKMEKLLEVKNLGVKFKLDGGTIFEAVKGVSFDIPKNSTVALVGESGSGKSVSAMSIIRLLPREQAIIMPNSEVLFEGRDLLKESDEAMRKIRGAQISVIFQPTARRCCARSPTPVMTWWCCAKATRSSMAPSCTCTPG